MDSILVVVAEEARLYRDGPSKAYMYLEVVWNRSRGGSVVGKCWEGPDSQALTDSGLMAVNVEFTRNIGFRNQGIVCH